jgi:hypothetical protein
MDVDHSLIYRARRLITGANVHRLGTLIFEYELAIKMHNHGRPGPHIDPIKCEQALRSYIAEQTSLNGERRAA